ncbi:MAG: molybdate ABC transporter substrate-binding protein [Chloroflexus sp.]|uniref:molybdate ABC transporter substrate-binding protein n=1 Tax=Chloroflexus sp. TaxID=1904827 RepID=UPI00404A9071
MLRRWCSFLITMLLLMACSINQPDTTSLTIAAAADLTPAFNEIGPLFTAKTGVPVVFNFGSTGQLAQQIERGAPVDIFYAANRSFIEDLEKKQIVDPSSLMVYAQGRITIWTRADSALQPQQISDLIDPAYKRIAIANPEHAPYGQAAREALERAGIWDEVQDRLVFGENVAQTLTIADTGNVEVAIVALSLSIQSNGHWVLIPAELHPDHPLIQMAGMVRSSRYPTAGRQFMEFVNGPEGRPIMEKYGFVLPAISETP